MVRSDGLQSAVFERESTRVISAAFVKAFLVVWSVYLERDVQGSFEKIKIRRSYMGTSLRRGTFPPWDPTADLCTLSSRSWAVEFFFMSEVPLWLS